MSNVIRMSLVSIFTLLSVVFTLNASAQTTTYTYDALGRVIIVGHDTDDDRLYEYDDAGNRTSITVYQSGGSSNAAPICNDWSVTVSTGTTSTSINPIAGHCSDADNDPLTLTNVTQPVNGATATISGNNIIFFNLPYWVTTVTFTVSDGNGGSDSAALSVIRPFSGGGNCGLFPC